MESPDQKLQGHPSTSLSAHVAVRDAYREAWRGDWHVLWPWLLVGCALHLLTSLVLFHLFEIPRLFQSLAYLSVLVLSDSLARQAPAHPHMLSWPMTP